MTAEISDTALLLDYEVINLNPRDNTLSVEDRMMTLQDIDSDLHQLPIIMSSTEYPEFDHLPFDRKWVQNHKKLFHHTEFIGFRNWVSVCHPSAVISASAKIGVNVFVNANSTISSNSKVFDNTLINRNVSIGHDVNIGSFCNIAPGVIITGATFIKDSVFIGSGSIIINGVVIGSGSTVAAGSLVTHNVPNSHLVMGSPARRKFKNYRKLRRKIIVETSKFLKTLGIYSLVKGIYVKLKH